MVKTQRLEWLEVMRGLAACWVLVHHAMQSAGHFLGLNIDNASGRLLGNGYLGVDFFFVLSGFIIAFATRRLLVRGGGVGDYFQARLLRIYVPYLPVGIGMYLLYLALPAMSEGGRTPGFLTSMTLLPSDSPAALSVAWTLVHEMIFYVAFSLVFVSRRVLWIALALWAIAIGLAWFLGGEYSRAWNYFLSPLNLYFLLGVLIHKASRHVRLGGGVVVLLALVGASIVGIQAWQMTPDRGWVGVGFGLLVLAAASPASGRLAPARLLVMIGAASYAIYLVHNPLLSIAARVAARVDLDGVEGLIAISTAALLGGLLYWRLYEQPALAAIRRWIDSRRAWQCATVSDRAR